MRARIAVRDVMGLSRSAPVCVAGRVVAIEPDGFILQDDTGCLRVRRASQPPASQPPLGAFVRLTGHSDGHELVQVDTAVTLTRGGEGFTSSDSDWTWLCGARLQNLRTRHRLKRAVERYFDAAGFIEVETPAIVPSPGLDVHLDALEVLGMGRSRWLHTSPEYQMKRLLTTGVPAIFQLGKAFRRGEHGQLHEPEFALNNAYA